MTVKMLDTTQRQTAPYRLAAVYATPGQYPVMLYTVRRGFAVQYGKQLTVDLDYEAATKELGTCLMHQLQCAGKID